MRVGVGLDGRLGLSFAELVEAGREAARLGFEALWTPAGGVPDAFHVCSAWAQATGLPTGTSVVPAARMWTVEALAAQAATVVRVGGAPFTLGIGTGGLGPGRWAAPEMPDRPIAAMRRYLEGLRRPAERGGFGLGLAALGPQMLRLAATRADMVLPNWSTPAAIAEARRVVGASSVRFTMYVRVCVDDDVASARRTLGAQVVTYALIPGYRAHFGRMGFEDVLTDLEARKEAGASTDELVDAAPDELLRSVGYFGSAAGAADAYRALSVGLDETVVRVLTARPSLDAVVATLAALNPEAVR